MVSKYNKITIFILLCMLATVAAYGQNDRLLQLVKQNLFLSLKSSF